MKRFFWDSIFFLLIITSFTLSAIKGFSSLSIVFTILFLFGMFEGRKLIFYRGLIWPTIFLVFNALSLLWGGDLEEVSKVSSAVLFGVAIFMGLKTGKRVPVLVAALTVSAIANIVLSYGNMADFQVDEESRVSGLFGNANDVAVFLSLAAFTIYFLSSKRTLLIKLMTFSILAFVFFYTGSRQGLFLVVFILGAIFINYYRGLNTVTKFWFLPVFLAVLLCSMTLLQVVQNYSEDVIVLKRLDTFLSGTEKGSAQTRSFMIEKGLTLWHEKPILGWGAGGFAHNSYFGVYSHNTYVELLVNYGLVGFCLYFAFSIYLFIKGWETRPNSFASIGIPIILMLLVVGMWAVMFRSKTGWLFLGIAAYCVSLRDSMVTEARRIE